MKNRALKMTTLYTSSLVLAVVTIISPLPGAADVSNLEDFNNVSNLTNEFNDDGTPAFSNQANGGINDTGSVNVPIGSDEIWTTKQGYSVTGNAGDTYTFSAYFKVAVNSGYGNLGFTATDTNTTASKGQPALGLGANFHGGGGGFFNDGTETLLSWPPDLVLGNWYWMTFEVTAQGSNTFDLKLQIWETDGTGTIGVMKTEKTLAGVTNATLGAATTIHAFFGASGSRMDTIDDFKIELTGSATFVEEDEPVVVPGTLGVPDDTTVSYGGNVTDDQGFSVTAKGTCWSTSPNPTTADDCTDDGSGLGAFISSVTGLTPGTTYYIRTYATNAQGTTYGAEESFTTTGTAPEPGSGSEEEEVSEELEDTDGVDNAMEAAAPNNGDANGDGTADNMQQTVASTRSPVSKEYVSVEAGSCSAVNALTVEEEVSDETDRDADYDYPAGLVDFTLTGCAVGSTETVTQYYFGDFDLNDVVLRKYDKDTDTYTTIEGVALSAVTIGGEPAIKAVYSVTDGGELDVDGVADGTIIDPVGLGTNVLSETGTSSGKATALGIGLIATAFIVWLQSRKQSYVRTTA